MIRLEEAKQNIMEAQKRQKEAFDKKHANPERYRVGQLVLKKDHTRKKRKGGKLETRFLGPYTICRVLTRGVYMLRDPAGNPGHTIQATGGHLKPYIQPLEREQPDQPEEMEQPDQREEMEQPDQREEMEQPDQPMEMEQPHQPKAKRRKVKRRKRRVLSEEELLAVRRGDKLSDIHIVAAQNMMQEEFPDLEDCSHPC